MSVRVHLASRNPGKLAEMERILAEHLPGVEVVGLDAVPAYDEPVEDAPDFVGNARIKARAGYAATGLPTVADDSGLCVDALNGMPGVLSARWSGPPTLRDASFLGSSGTGNELIPRAGQDERNNTLLLHQLADVPDERRTAHFTASVVAVLPGGGELAVEGRMPGRVTRAPRGDGGFGYDVVFEADDRPGLTTAELTREDKDAISHRGRALRDLAPRLAEALRS